MTAKPTTPVAMILPVPVATQVEDSLQFVDFSGYPKFFDDVRSCFPADRFLGLDAMGAVAAGNLSVHKVGHYDASFVPSRADFSRLDPRFQLDGEIWAQLPDYQTYGFAVFQLRDIGPQTFHPMAFWFNVDSTNDGTFFPTVHFHGGVDVSDSAMFDHELFFQGTAPHDNRWETSTAETGTFVMTKHLLKGDLTKGIVNPDLKFHRMRMQGAFPNQDTWLNSDR